jgi:hypothetical protein
MGKVVYRIKGEGIVSMNSVDSLKGLKLKMRLKIIPPRDDIFCDCCQRPISQLKSFGKAGDPLVGDFDGDFLVKTGRPYGPYVQKSEEAFIEANKQKSPLKWILQKYGIEKAYRICWDIELYRYHDGVWLCRDCIILDCNEYHQKMMQSLPPAENIITKEESESSKLDFIKTFFKP